MITGCSLTDPLLSLPAVGYYAVQKIREKAYDWGILSPHRAPVTVISVGNLVLGGSGKTPFAIYLAGMLAKCGLKPAVVSRGYRGASRAPYLVVGDGSASEPLVGPDACGDEPYLIAERLPDIPVIVGRKRIYPVRAAKQLFGCNIVVLDDGFQHLPLRRDADIVLLNGSEDHMFPRGRLREPLSALKRADIVVLVAADAIPAFAKKHIRAPIFRCRPVAAGLQTDLASRSSPAEGYSGRDVVLVSGIANPARFRSTAERLRWRVKDHHAFPDHHAFRDRELRSILDRAAGLPVVFTEKDWVKLPQWIKEMDHVAALRIEMVLEDEPGFWNALGALIPALT